MSMNHVMVDLETMGTNPNAPIVAIGAVCFDPVARTLGETFYENISLEDAVNVGGVMDASTVLWWLQQTAAAREELLHNTQPLSVALLAFTGWVEQHSAPEVLVWGNGATFDNVILAASFARMRLNSPWHFANDRCFRTLKNLCPVEAPAFEGIPHHALYDALHQAKHALAIAEAYPNLNWMLA